MQYARVGDILTILPPSKQPIGMALFGMTATFGPSIGPTIGGWLTDNYGWQWIFSLMSCRAWSCWR
jgi:DHA2 family multidrug resistance protein